MTRENHIKAAPFEGGLFCGLAAGVGRQTNTGCEKIYTGF
jgi:hypothetical protein